MSKDLPSLVLKFFERISVKAVGFVIGVVLARLLLPEDFGKIAIIMVFINISQVLITSGFNSSLVQKKNVDNVDYSTAFCITESSLSPLGSA